MSTRPQEGKLRLATVWASPPFGHLPFVAFCRVSIFSTKVSYGLATRQAEEQFVDDQSYLGRKLQEFELAERCLLPLDKISARILSGVV